MALSQGLDRGHEPVEGERVSLKDYRLRAVVAFVVLAGFYVLTSPSNHSEADDALWYAWDVEQAAWPVLFHPFHVIYLPVARLAWRAVHALGGPERAYSTLIVLGALASAGAVLLSWDLLVRRLGVTPGRAAFAAALLAFSYGTWRYAGEAEVYAPALLSSVVLAHLSLAARPGVRGRIGLVVAGAVAPLVHILAVAGSMIAVPIAVWSLRGRRAALGYAVATAVLGLTLATAGYALAGRPADNVVDFYRGEESTATIGGAGDIVRHAVAASQVVVSGNFILTYEPVRQAISSWFPGRMLYDETYAGSHAPSVVRWLAPATLALLVAGLLWFVLTAGRPARSAGRTAAARFGGIWLVSHILLGVVFSRAGQPEVWMLAVFPAWLLFTAFFVRSDAPVLPLAAFAVALTLHNGIGGLAVYAPEDGDRNLAKATPVIVRTNAEDVVLTAESAVFTRYLTYWGPARVAHLLYRDPDEVRRIYGGAVAGGGRVFATGDVFDIPDYYGVVRPAWADSLRRIMTQLRPEFVLDTADEFGGVYRLRDDVQPVAER